MKKRRRLRKVWKVLFMLNIVMMIALGGFRVQALASTPDCRPTERVYTSITIKDGDSLWKIAENYGEKTTNKEIKAYVEEIKELNEITDDYYLIPGEHLVIYVDRYAS